MAEPPSISGTEASSKQGKRWNVRIRHKSKETSAETTNAQEYPSIDCSINGEQESSSLVISRSVDYTPTANQTEKLNSDVPHNSQSTVSTDEHSRSDKRVTNSDDMIRSLKQKNGDLEQKLEELSLHIRQLQKDNEELRRQCIESAERSYTKSQPHMPLSKPNSEIVKDWNTLAYDVENLVDNHFRDASQKVILSWATLQIQDLPDIFGAPRDIVTSRKSGIALIKAALWSELSSMFAYSCWAGHYRRDMQTLFTKLEADFSAERNAARPPPYHHCKTLMTNLISTLETREQRGQVVGHVAIAIAELLAPCRPRHLSFNTYHSDLRAVVHKAVNMDLALHGQMDAYTLQWRTGKVFEDAYMAPASGCSQGSSKNVRFRIRPGLYRADAQGDSFSNFAVVEKATVWL